MVKLTHQTAGDAEPDPRIPHPPHMKSPHPPQMKAWLESVSQTEASLSLKKANMRFWFVRHGLIGFVRTQGSFKTSCTVMKSMQGTKAFATLYCVTGTNKDNKTKKVLTMTRSWKS